MRLMKLGQFEALTDPLTDYYLYPNSNSADPRKMLRDLDRIIDTTLLTGLNGLARCGLGDAGFLRHNYAALD